jgi:homoserine kinase type II
MAHAHRITAGELVVVCSHFDLGEIEEVRRFRGGSRVAPKVFIKASGGEFLLKRRAPGPGGEPTKVAFTHEVMLHLAQRGFPVPGIVGTRSGNSSMLQLGPGSPGGGGVYEVFRFVRGVRYDRSAASAFAAGWWLARCHLMLRDFRPLFPAPRRTFHAHPKVPERLASISGSLNDPALRAVTRTLGDAYVSAAREADRFAGAAGDAGAQDDQIVHGDWHPGNMLFREGALPASPSGAAMATRVAAVFDFDSARMGRPLHDLANGAMQFAVQRFMGAAEPEGEEDDEEGAPPKPPVPASAWRIALDPELLGAFYKGYRAAGGGEGGGVTAEVLRAVPWLMIEALIVEACVPIAATGKFGKLSPAPVLGVVHRAVEALAGGAERIVELARGL